VFRWVGRSLPNLKKVGRRKGPRTGIPECWLLGCVCMNHRRTLSSLCLPTASVAATDWSPWTTASPSVLLSIYKCKKKKKKRLICSGIIKKGNRKWFKGCSVLCFLCCSCSGQRDSVLSLDWVSSSYQPVSVWPNWGKIPVWLQSRRWPGGGVLPICFGLEEAGHWGYSQDWELPWFQDYLNSLGKNTVVDTVLCIELWWRYKLFSFWKHV
jgi:hypothetical protein